MPTRITRCDSKHQEAQVAESEGILVGVFTVSTAGYTARKLVFRILCGSI